MFLFYFHTLRFGCPNILFPKKKKVGKFISSRVGTVSHIKAGNLSNFTKASKAVAAGGGGSSSGVPIGWVFSSETGGVTSENDGYSLSHWVFPVYLQIGDLKPVYQLALKMMAILSIKSLNA